VGFEITHSLLLLDEGILYSLFGGPEWICIANQPAAQLTTALFRMADDSHQQHYFAGSMTVTV